MKEQTLLHQGLYSLGNSGKSSLATLFDVFALFYLTDVLKVPPLFAANIILVSMIWDGFSDSWMALLIDKLRRHFSTVKVYFFIGVPIAALATISFFNAHKIPEGFALLYSIAVLIVFRTAYTLFDVPHNSLLSFLSNDSKLRTRIAAMRIFCSSIGRFLVTIVSIDFLAAENLTEIQNQFSLYSVLFSVFFILVMSICLLAIKDIKIIHDTEVLNDFKLADMLKSFHSNRSLLIVFGLTAITSVSTLGIGSSFIYFAKYSQLDESSGGVALSIMAVGQAFSLFFWTYLSNKRWGTVKSCFIANAILCLTMLGAMLGIHDEIHLYTIAIVTGIALAGISVFNWALLPEAIDRGHFGSERRYDVSIFGFYTLANKICNGLSLAYVGWVLTLFEYVPDQAIMSESIGSITTTILFLPALGCSASILLLKNLGKYKVNQS